MPVLPDINVKAKSIDLDHWTQHDPQSQPGYLYHNTTDEYQSEWRSFNKAEAAPNWIVKIRHAHLCSVASDSCDISEDLKPLMDATILLIGDSVDRNTVSFTGDNIGSTAVKAAFDNITNPAPAGWDDRGLPRIMKVPTLRLTVANCFIYGLDDHDFFRKQEDWHSPELAEERVEQLCAPLTRQLDRPPSVIQLHSGM